MSTKRVFSASFTFVIAPFISFAVAKENKVEVMLLSLPSFFDSNDKEFIFTFALFKNSLKLSELLISNLISLNVPETGTFFSVLNPVHLTPKSPLIS